MYFFPDLEPVCCSTSSSSSCFLTCIQISQEADKLVLYSHLIKYFPQVVVIHTVKCFGVINKAEGDVFLELSCFSYDPTDVDNLTSGFSAFSNLAWTSGSSRFTYYWSLAWRTLSITSLECEMSAIVQQLKHFLTLSFFGIVMKTDIFPLLLPLLSFPHLLAYWEQHFHSIIF